MFLSRYKSSGGQGCFSVGTGPQEEDGVFLCRYLSSGRGQGCFSVDTCPQLEDRGVSL